MVRVTAEHISRGKRGSADTCPIALALHELKDVITVGVTQDKVSMSRYCNRTKNSSYDIIWYELPPEAQEFVRNFDNNMGVDPIEFELGRTISLMRIEDNSCEWPAFAF